MAVDLEEKQFELGGVVFGYDCRADLAARGFQPGAAAMRKQRTDNPNGDGVRMGIDRYGGATWVFEGFTNLETEEAAWAAVEELAAPWSADDVRGRSGAVVPLRYRLAGQRRVIYGRPGRFQAIPEDTSTLGMIRIVAEFDTVDHLVYDDEMQSISMPLTPPLAPEAGLLVPFIPPVTLSPREGAGQYQITVGGTVATPLIITVKGPLSPGTLIRIDDVAVQIEDAVAANDPVIIDARPWANSAVRQSGAPVRLNARVSRISRMRMAPGVHSVIFTGTDVTGAAELTVSWQNARRSPR